MQTPEPHTRRRMLGHAAYGVLATVVGLAAAHLVAALTVPAASPVLAVGSTVIDLTPTPLKEWAIRQFGTADKVVLVGSVILVVLLLAAVAGIVAARRETVGLLIVVGLAAWPACSPSCARAPAPRPRSRPGRRGGSRHHAVVAEPHRPDLRRIVARGRRSEPARGRAGNRRPRRGCGGHGGRSAAGSRRTASAGPTSRCRLPPILRPPSPQGLEATYDDISPLRTSNADFYRVDTRLTVPSVDVDTWTLTIDGDVDEEITLTFDDLAAMGTVERDITLTCVSNEVGGQYVGSARWLGVPLADVLARAGIDSTKADQILSTDVDGMTISTPFDVALDGRDALIAIGMNGEPLPRTHGFPARMVVPGLYGFVSACKWITRMTLTTYDAEQAYWTERDWAIEAPIKLSSRIDTPKPLSDSTAGKVVIGGIAWAQTVGIEKVEVRIDGEAWKQATLGPQVTDDYWRQWFYEWDAVPGQHFIACRATNKDGEVQTAVRMEPFPEGSSGLQEISVSVS